MSMPNATEVYRQSKAAFKQWDSDWTRNCGLNRPFIKNSMDEIRGEGENRSILAVAYGPSLGKNLSSLKTLQDMIPIICADKAFKTLMANGIKPKYIVVADANVNYKKYGEGVDSSGTAMIINVCGNHEWVKNWKGKIYFYVNTDNLGTQFKYSKLTGINDFISAASNVGNAVVVILREILRYQQILFVGYDYSWSSQYYGDEENQEKKYYMNHMKMVDFDNNLVSTSMNLDFSCRWLLTYLTRFRMNVVNLSGQGILDHRLMGVPVSTNFRHGEMDSLVESVKGGKLT